MLISEEEARRIASEWHGGQWSALYAFASTGTTDLARMINEVSEDFYGSAITDKGRVEILSMLLVAAVKQYGTPPVAPMPVQKCACPDCEPDRTRSLHKCKACGEMYCNECIVKDNTCCQCYTE